MTRSERLSLILVLSLFALAGWTRMNDLSLYTDSTRYLIWAESLSRGLGWVDATQPVPEAYVVNAPLYPVWIIPTQWIAGGSLLAAKTMTLLYGLTALALFLLWLRTWLPVRTAHIVVWLFAITPLTLVIFTEALSEAPFFMLVFFALWMRERATQRLWTVAETVLVVAALALMPLLREISVAVVAAFVIDAVVRRHYRFAVTLAVAMIAAVGLWTLRNMVIVGVPESSQSTNIQFIFEHFVTPSSAPIWQEWLQRFVINIRSYQFELSGMALVPFPLNLIRNPTDIFVGMVSLLNLVKGWTALIFLPLVAAGIWSDIRTSQTALIRILFFCFYAGIILLYPLQDIRFFLPAIPFLLIWVAMGVSRLVAALPKGGAAFAAVATSLLVILNASAVAELLGSNVQYRNAVEAHREGGAPFHATGYYATPWQLAGDALMSVTEPGIVIASASKEIVPFVRGRSVLEVNRAVPLPMFESMLREFDVHVLLVQQVRSGIRSHEIQLAESHRFRFDTIAAAGWLTAYRVRNRAREGLSERHTAPDPLEGVLSLVHDARTAIHRGRFHVADSLLAMANGIDPVNVEVAYQRVVAAALGGSLEEAVAAQQRLFSTPRSTSYTPPGRVLLSLAQALNAAAGGGVGADRAHWFFQASRMAWDLGYGEQAIAFSDSALEADPRHFESLLWNMHYRYQAGDSVAARSCLATLRAIDPENPVVRGFVAIDSLSGLLPKTSAPEARAIRLLDISRVYERIGLPEEALDMADRAWMALPQDARTRTVEILTNTGRTAGADRYRNLP